MTALMHAVRKNSKNIFPLLLSEVKYRDNRGFTALMHAAKYDYYYFVKQLQIE